MNTLLFQRFVFKKPIENEDIEKGQEVIALPEKTILRADKESFTHDLAEMCSLVKLAEIDPLLVTFFFQPDYS